MSGTSCLVLPATSGIRWQRTNSQVGLAPPFTPSYAHHIQSGKFVADTILVVFSFRLLWNVNLPSRQRRMILAIFSSSIIMTMFSLFHAVTNFIVDIWIEMIAVNLEVESFLHLIHSKLKFLCLGIIFPDNLQPAGGCDLCIPGA